jgi:endogenous inhibitor of DNA gyrase (YacG/DUF329 family)
MSTGSKADRCPLCGRAAAAPHRPFCSQGCKDRDLLNWLGDAYRMPGAPADPEDFAGAEESLDRQG